jgi:hypothetical protein
MEPDALKIAILAAGADTDIALPALHGELEHWLNRTLLSEELDAALDELAAAGLVQLGPETYVTNAAGRSMVAQHWETFFPA